MLDILFQLDLPVWLVYILDITLKSSILLLFALLITGIRRRISASFKHYLLSVVFGLLLLLPFAIVLAPNLSPVNNQKNHVDTSSPTQPFKLPQKEGEIVTIHPPTINPFDASLQAPSSANSFPSFHQTEKKSFVSYLTSHLPSIFLLIWGSGFLFILLRLLIGMIVIWKKSLSSDAIIESNWGTWVSAFKKRLDIQRPVILLRSHLNESPVTWGTFRPIVLLPQHSTQWEEDKIKGVLLHEMAHISRWDTFLQTLAQLVCAIYWMNPLVWLAYREFILEREHACDDAVLRSGIKATEYASLLVKIAKDSSKTSSFSTLSAVHMARESQLKDRVRVVLEDGRERLALSKRDVKLGLFAASLFLIPATVYWPWMVEKSTIVSGVLSSWFLDGSEESKETTFSNSLTRSSVFEEPIVVNRRNQNRLDATPFSSEPMYPNLDKSILKTIIKATKDQSSNVRFAAFSRLSPYKFDSNVRAIMQEGLKDPSSNIRFQVLKDLLVIRSDESTEIALSSLDDPSSNVRTIAVEYLSRIRGNSAIEQALKRLLFDPSSNVRTQALDVLQGKRDPETKQLLLQKLDDESSNVRMKALSMLLAFPRDNEITTGLSRLSDDPNNNIRLQSFYSLTEPSTNGIPPNDEFFNSLIKQALNGSESVTLSTLQTIKKLEDEYFITPLATLLTHPSSRVRSLLAEVYGAIEEDMAIPYLAQLLADEDKSVKLSALQAMSLIESETAIPHLAQALEDDSPTIRLKAIEVMRIIEGESAIPYLSNYVRSTTLTLSEVRAVAITVGKIEEVTGIEILSYLLSNPLSTSEYVDILQAIERIEEPEGIGLVQRILSNTNEEAIILKGLKALGHIEDERALPIITSYLDADSDAVKMAASSAYTMIIE